jgi:UDP:flavonoid glycosyltransferase YjiC (YdhE family)
MKCVLACYGSRGDVEPGVALGRELQRRGHDVCMAVAPDLVDFATAAGLAAVAYGPNTQSLFDVHRNFWTCLTHNPWKILELIRLARESWQLGTQSWVEMTRSLKSQSDGADVIFTGLSYLPVAANVAERYDIPLAILHQFPLRINSRMMSVVPPPLVRAMTKLYEWLAWRGVKGVEDAQRRELGLPESRTPMSQRIGARDALEIQAYDEACFPGLAAEWGKPDNRRPFVGTLTLELATDADEEVSSWIAAGSPPIFFGFGSIPVVSALATIAMINTACVQLGQRALLCAAATDFSDASNFENVKVVRTLNYAATFPACRAVVHHGGAGTTAAGLRAGIPTLSLWTGPDQASWAAQIRRLKVGTSRRFSATTEKSLVADLRTILAPQYLARARDLATRMTRPADSVAATADLLEKLAGSRDIG